MIDLHPMTELALAPILDYCANDNIDLYNFLYIEHWVMEKHLKDMAEEWGVDRWTLTKFMDRIGIGHRTLREAQLITAKNPTDAMLNAQERWLAGGHAWARSPEGRKFNSERFSGDNSPSKRPEVRAKISESKKGRNNPMYGRYGSDNPAWCGGNYRYSPGFYQIRGSILERDNDTCQLCGKDGDNVHHINYFRKDNDPLNLVVLCHQCHMGTNNGTDNRARWQDYFTCYQRRVRSD